MSLTIIVPVKQLAEAKSRLADVLSAEERQALALELLTGVLAVVRQAQAQLPARGLVISADPAVLDLAVTFGLTPLPESEDQESKVRRPESKSHDPLSTVHCPLSELPLNAALEQATTWAVEQGAGAVLVLPADLPLLTVDDVRALWRAGQQLYSARAVVIAPDGRGSGTNALLVRPPGALRYQFGPDSFSKHLGQAQRLGLAWQVWPSARLALDVDLPDDLAELRSHLAVEQADVALATGGKAPGGRAATWQAKGETRMQPLIDERVAAFLQQPGLLMRLGTVGGDGYPQVTPVWFLYEAGLFYVTTARDRVKTGNMLANPKVGFAVDSEVRPYRGVSVWGRARLVAEGAAAASLTRRIAARYVAPERLDAMVETLMEAPRVVFAIEPVRAAPMGSWEVAVPPERREEAAP